MTVTDNVTLVGNVLLNNHVLGNFSTGAYAYNAFVPHLPDYDTWEVSAKVITGSGYSSTRSYSIIVCGDIDKGLNRNCGFLLRIYPKKFNLVVERYTNSYQEAVDLYSDTIQDNTEYIVKGRFTGSRYELEVNGTVVAYKDATWKGLYNASRMPHLAIGAHSIYSGTSDASPAFIGSIDLTKCYFKANGNVLWNGVERSKTHYSPARKTSGFYIPSRKRDVQIVNTSILNTGSGSMGSDYTMSFDNQNQRPYTVDVMPLDTADNWEWRTKFNRIDGGSNYGAVIGHNNSNYCSAPYIQIVKQESGMTPYSADIVIPITSSTYIGSENYNHVFSANTPYYVKMGFTGTEYYLDVNTSGWDAPFERWSSYQSTSKCYIRSSTKTSFMSRYSNYSYGTIDFKETRLFINGQVYWEYITDKTVRDFYIPSRRDFSDAEIPTEYGKLLDIIYDGDTYYETNEKLFGTDSLTLKIEPTGTTGRNVIGCYSGTGSSARNFSVYIYGGGSTSNSYIRYGTTLARPNFGSGSRTISITPTGTTGFATDATYTSSTFETTDTMRIGALPNSSSPKFIGTMEGSILVSDRLKYVPVIRYRDGEIGYYEPHTGVFLTNQGTGTPTTSGYDNN